MTPTSARSLRELRSLPVLRLSAGRTAMTDETQSLRFLVGANSIFFGDKLLTTSNPRRDQDHGLLDRLGLRPQKLAAAARALG